MRFTRQQHLRTAQDFASLRSDGNRRECGYFSIIFKSCPERIPPVRRLGVIASRRVGNAVARNRAKRLLRETFRIHQQMLPSSCDLVLIARASILDTGLEVLGKRFRGAMDSLVKEMA